MEWTMTYIVNENCIKCKYTDCVEVCPVDCFYEGENMLIIHPDECIDCGVCEPECPVDAIKPDTEPGLEKWLVLNRDYAEKWPTSRPRSRLRRMRTPIGTRRANSTSTFRPSRVKATEPKRNGVGRPYLGRTFVRRPCGSIPRGLGRDHTRQRVAETGGCLRLH